MADLNNKSSRKLLSELGKIYGEVRYHSFLAMINLFLDPATRTTLNELQGISSSTGSRFCANHTVKEYGELWKTLNSWQMNVLWNLYGSSNRRGRRQDVMLKIDLTSIEKTGIKLPFVRLFNKIFGIHIVVLHAHVGDISFPMAFRFYLGKGTTTQVKLVLGMLKEFPPEVWPSRVIVLADAGFGSKEFIRGCLELGFERVIVGIRKDRKLKNGKRLDQEKKGSEVILHDMKEVKLTMSWKRVKRQGEWQHFYIVSTFAGSGRWLARRYRLRWLIESFFQAVKYDFGLNETRLRTEMGMKVWIYLVFLGYSLAVVGRANAEKRENGRYLLTMSEAAREMAELLFIDFLIEITEKENQRLKEKKELQRAKTQGLHECE